MDPFEIRDRESWISLLTTVAEASGLAMSLTDPGGKIILSAGDRNPLCTKIRDNSQALTYICSQTNTAMTQQVKETMKPVLETCEGGMLRLAMPIIRNGEVIGQVTGCGVAEDLEEIDPFYLSQQIGLTEEEVGELVGKVPVKTPESLQDIAKDVLPKLNPED